MKHFNFMHMLMGTQPQITGTFYGWLILAFCFLILEMGHPGLFFFISFFFGGLVAAGVSCINESIIIQTISFFAGTASALCVLRYWIMPLLGKDRPHERTNVYALKGKHGFVVQQVSPENPGLVRVSGELWAARVVRDESLIVGATVEVIDVRGAHVVVKRI